MEEFNLFPKETASEGSLEFGITNETEGQEDEEEEEKFYDVFIPILYCLVCVLGLAGNSVVISTILHQNKMRTVANIYIFNLAVADGLFMLGLPFLALQIALHRWIFGNFMCRLVMILDGINQFTSVSCLTIMSIDRYIAVVHPISSSKWRTPNLAKKISVLLWVFSFIPVLPMAIYSGVDHSLEVCTLLWPEPYDTWSTAFIVYTFVLGFALPFIVVSSCYLLLIVRLKTLERRSRARSAEPSERKITKMVIAIVITFAICWLPFYILNICFLVLIVNITPLLRRLFEFVVVLSYSNSCTNPILYVCLSENFRKSFLMMLCPRRSAWKRRACENSSPGDCQMQCLTETQTALSSGDDVIAVGP
ncbi:somatostatin receptor type 2-like [Latimeria chalumnae]|uniref:somatostatin receptor type 2-like n=1 Tax=Latimeria chalumnae TaxID=7897 RepID=UPI0003C155BA|nr:PREDICTED: somatostatin receptor type 2-like [Latimeria chalumnae]|eukprot:XP_005988145.1 PREDICTED: somatostatin receptor type 2-like [Latimeria chalumnae]